MKMFKSILVLLCTSGLLWPLATLAQPFSRVDIQPLDPAFFIPKRHEGRTYFITGGARGIGAASAQRLAREGARVLIFDVLATEGKATVEKIRQEGGQAEFVQGDVRSTLDLDRAVKVALHKFGAINGALNAAGVMAALPPNATLEYDQQKHLLPSPVAEASDEYFDTLMAVNATGIFKSMRAQLGPMLRQGKGGSIVNICSIAGLTGLAHSSAYVASKHACNGLTRSAAVDYAAHGIRVNSVNMSATETAMTDMAFQFVKASSQVQPQTLDPAGRPAVSMARSKTMSLLALADSQHRQATVWEQAAMICFLLSDEASNLTGGLFATDGGWTAY